MSIFHRIGAFWRWIPAFLWMGFIFYLSSKTFFPTPHMGGVAIETLARKGGHGVMYAILALLLWFANPKSGKEILWGVLIASLYGATDEIHQHFVGRDGNVYDWVVDTLGAGMAGYAIQWLRSTMMVD